MGTNTNDTCLAEVRELASKLTAAIDALGAEDYPRIVKTPEQALEQTDMLGRLVEDLRFGPDGAIERGAICPELPIADLRAMASTVEFRARVQAQNLTIEQARLLGAALLFAADMAHLEAVRTGKEVAR